MENYINVLRCILKHFNIRKNNEFDNIIKYIIVKIFDEYYNNRDKSKYCIDNLIRRCSMRYFELQIKYGTVKNCKMIYRFNRYSRRNYMKKLLRNHECFYIDEYYDEDNNKVADDILQMNNIKNYKKYIENLYLDNYIDRIDKILNIKLEKIQLNKKHMNTYKNYIDLLRDFLKNFDNNEFGSMIKKILSKIFNDYYMNRNSYIYCIDNLYKDIILVNIII